MNLIGIDLGTRKIAMSCFRGDELVDADIHIASEATLRSTQLHELALFAYSKALAFDADQVWVEDIIVGNNRRYSIMLAEAKGAVLSALDQLRCDIRSVDNKSWKKELIGNGNIDKSGIRDYIDVTYGAYAPLCGDDQDKYDATCIGLYGLRINQRAQDLRL